MIELDTVLGGPSIHKTEEFNPTQVLVSLIDENPGASREELKVQFREKVRDDDDYLIPIIDYYFLNAFRGLGNYKTRSSHTARRTQEEIKKKAAEIAAKVRSIIILDLMLPCGKSARTATFEDLRRAGGFWSELSSKGKPNQVAGKVLKDEQVQKLWAEYTTRQLKAPRK